jgi:hypothetical protein
MPTRDLASVIKQRGWQSHAASHKHDIMCYNLILTDSDGFLLLLSILYELDILSSYSNNLHSTVLKKIVGHFPLCVTQSHMSCPITGIAHRGPRTCHAKRWPILGTNYHALALAYRVESKSEHRSTPKSESRHIYI